jgi:hypothetical protein
MAKKPIAYHPTSIFIERKQKEQTSDHMKVAKESTILFTANLTKFPLTPLYKRGEPIIIPLF